MINVAERVQSDIDLPGTPPGLDVGTRPTPQQLEEALAGIKSAGALFPGNALVYQVGAQQVGVASIFPIVSLYHIISYHIIA